MNICYADLRGELEPEYVTYYFNPRRFVENSEERTLRFYAREASRFWVEVVISNSNGQSSRPLAHYCRVSWALIEEGEIQIRDMNGLCVVRSETYTKAPQRARWGASLSDMAIPALKDRASTRRGRGSQRRGPLRSSRWSARKPQPEAGCPRPESTGCRPALAY
jgi:hypothetical protein